MALERTYEMATGGPGAMAWEDYARRLGDEWRVLLDSEDAREEKLIQRFLEQHPSLVPGAFDSLDSPGSGHYPVPGAVIAQPPLSGLTRRVPDFMWLAKDSARLCPIVVEIESPKKRWFNENGVSNAKFVQAQNQLLEWKIWFEHSSNKEWFRDFYAISDKIWRHLAFKPKFVLIYGRRQEFIDEPELNQKRMGLQRADEIHMTYDRLFPEPKAAELLSVTIQQPGKYEALHWPACAHLGPTLAHVRSGIDQVEKAIATCDWISDERRRFLLLRNTYWQEWMRGPRGGVLAGERE